MVASIACATGIGRPTLHSYAQHLKQSRYHANAHSTTQSSAALVAGRGASHGATVCRRRCAPREGKAIHARVLSLDTHVDIAPTNFNVVGPNYTQRLPRTLVDLVKMEEGGLGGGFLAVYVGQ